MTQELKMTLEVSDVNDALNEAARLWDLPAESIHAEILSTEREGFLGLFGNKKIRVELTAERDVDIMERSREFVDEVLRLMDFDAHSVQSETERNMLDIQGEDAADHVVGHYGDALKGMEYIVNLALRDPKSEPRVRLDSCGYRERRTKSLERLAEATARQALKYGRPMRLDPMASWERWVIHTTLKGMNDVTTESVGEYPNRKVVIIPKFEPDDARALGPATMRFRAQRERTERMNVSRDSTPRNFPRNRRRNRNHRGNRDSSDSQN